ncbi:hypothetical protein R3P38DRAFT_1423478 [Favolaschia claudopus]|uniref:Uncharacterized protein n=1 Tax=Favolaschia claudopus TaxID=2862362 RepID=A0AAW0APR5_9AGAR
MPAPCKFCGSPTVVDDAGIVCTNCAELAEPSLVVLASDTDYLAPTTYDGWIPVATKALKTGRNRYLSGQGKEARDGKNLDEMHWFIKNLARAVLVSGVTERAYNLFEKAMKSGQYRWGRAAKLVAAASISIALRQSNRPDMFPQLARCLEQNVTSLTRAFSSVISVLKIQPRDLPSSGPKSHVSILHSHFSAILQGSADFQLPAYIITEIKPKAPAILDTAASLSDLLASSIPPSTVAHLPVSATACAIYMWAIEAELRDILPQLGDLAGFLGSKCNVKRPLVMSRYKLIQDELIQRIDRIVWLDHYAPNTGKNGRAKVSRRVVAARGVKEVIESERQHRMQSLDLGKRALRPEGEESDSDADGQPSRPRKRRKVHALQDATRFLLNPLCGPLPTSFLSPSPSALPLTTYLLTSPLSLRRDKMPTRLQLLSVARGGVGPEEIADDELFDDGELDKLMRTDVREIADLRSILGWPAGEENDEKPPAQSTIPYVRKPRKRAGSSKDPSEPTTSARLNPAAVALFFADEKSDDYDGLLRLDDADMDDSKEPELIVINDGDDTAAFAGLQRTLVESFASEDDDDLCFPCEDRYAQEI